MTPEGKAHPRKGARIVFDEDRRGWVIEVGPEPGRALLADDRLIESEAEAEELLRRRGYRWRQEDRSDWPWQHGEQNTEPGNRACVDDWARPPRPKLLSFEGDER